VPVTRREDLASTPLCPPPKARKLCPSLITVSGDSRNMRNSVASCFSYAYDHTPVVEVASIDEGYFDLRGNSKRSREGGKREVIRTRSVRA